MAWWGNITGTVTGYLRLGLTGVRLKNSAGELAVRNAGDTADAPLKASAITLTGAVSTNTVYAGPTSGVAAVPGFRGVVHEDFSPHTSIEVSGSTQAIAAATATALIFPTKTKDVLGEYDTTTGAFTPQNSGTYLVWVSTESTTAVVDQRVLVSISTAAGVGGTVVVLNGYTSNAASLDISAARPVELAGGTTYYFNIYCSNAETLAGGEICALSINRIG